MIRAFATTCGLMAALTACTAFGQTNPTPQALPYSQNFGTTNFTTPFPGWAGWNGISGSATTTQTAAENSVPTGDASIIGSTPTNGGTGGLYGFNVAGDGRAGVNTSGNGTNGVNQWVLAVDTTGVSNIVVSCDLINTIANLRTVGCVIQYRVGTSGPWTTALGIGMPYEQSGGVVGTVTPVSVTLGNEANNQPEVQIRWAVWRGTEAGSSSAFAIDNVNVIGGGQEPQGSCCIGEVCSITTQVNCAGSWTSGGSCAPTNPCLPPPEGACCVNGFCVGTFTEAECLATPGATWGGEGTDCGNFTCPVPVGRCCLPDNTCVTMVSEQDCLNQGGSNWVLNGFCDNFVCTPNTGACCLPDQSCVVASPIDCDAADGVYMGRGVACGSVSCAPASGVNLIAKYDFDVNVVGVGRNLSFSQSPTGPFTSAGDGFGVFQRFYSPTVPFTLLDDSQSIFPLDAIGVVNESKLDKWFGINDLLNPDNAAGTGTATWTFDISGSSNLSISIDMAAMGDFEATAAVNSIADEYDFFVSIDGGTPELIFSLRTDESATQTYTLQGGAVFTVDDPLVVNGSTVLSNIFQTLSASIAGTGNVLTLTLVCSNDADEAVVFDNIMIMGDLGATGACCLLNQTCSVMTAAQCATAGGFYLGDGAACNQATCNGQSVACCINGSCTVLALGGCVFSNGTPDSFAATCAGVSCPADCPADWDGNTIVEVNDIFAFLTDWFAGNPAATGFGGNPGVPAIFAFLTVWFAAGVGPC